MPLPEYRISATNDQITISVSHSPHCYPPLMSTRATGPTTAGLAVAPRERLVEAAESNFRRFGYRRTTVDEITRAAETGKGSFYLHFESKEAAYLVVVEASLARFLDLAEVALRREGSVPRRLRGLVEATSQYYGQDELLRSSLFGGGNLIDGQLSRRAAQIQRSRIRGLLAETLTAGIAEGTVRATIDPDATAEVLFEIGWAIVLSQFQGTSDIPFDTALNVLNEIVGLGLLTRDQPRLVRGRRRR